MNQQAERILTYFKELPDKSQIPQVTVRWFRCILCTENTILLLPFSNTLCVVHDCDNGKAVIWVPADKFFKYIYIGLL